MSVKRDVDAELRFHLETRVDELIQQGLTRESARAQALAEFGNVEQVRDGLEDIDRRVMRRRSRAERLDALLQDVKYAARSLRRSPAVSTTIILTLALGIGVNVAMFSLLDVIYFRPPSAVSQPESLRRVWMERRFVSGVQFWPRTTYAGYEAAKDAVAGQADATVYSGPEAVKVGRGENVPVVRAVGTVGNYFQLLGVKAARGRLFTEEEASPEVSAEVAVISDALWARLFARDDAVIGKKIQLGHRTLTIIGVAQPGFEGVDLDVAELWAPIAALFATPPTRPWWRSRGPNGLEVLLRLKPGAREGELTQRVTPPLRSVYATQGLPSPDMVVLFGPINRERGPGKVSMEMQVAKRLVAVATIVLLIACANVINLLLARAMSRRREIAVRLALGISRVRLIRLLVTESTLLAALGGAMAIAAAVWAGSAIRKLLMPDIQWHGELLHWRVLLFGMLVAIVAGAITGLVPALQSASPDLTDGLKAGTRNTGAQPSRLRAVLVTAQTALSVLLLVGAALFIRSLSNVRSHDFGFSVERLVFGSVVYDTKDSLRDALFSDRLRATESRAASIPGVTKVAFTSTEPKQGMSWTDYFPDVDTTLRKMPNTWYSAVSSNYFAATGSRFVSGHTFDRRAESIAAPAIVVNQALADALWPSENPIGRCIRLDKPRNPCAIVIGVVATVLDSHVNEKPQPQLYISLDHPAFEIRGATTIVVNADPERRASVEASLRDLLRSEFPGAVPTTRSMLSSMASEYRPWELGAKLFTTFGLLALFVAAIGIYSTIGYAVTQRSHEFGVRMALGARGRDLLRQVLGEGLRTIVVGLAVGTLLTLAASRVLRSLLYDVGPNDPTSFAVVITVLVLVAVAAALRPAWRAASADPVSALRAE